MSLQGKMKRAARRQRVSESQCPKFAKERKPSARVYQSPSWPHTANQIRQSRPVIIMRPVKQVVGKSESPTAREYRQDTYGLPKHELDAMARANL
jgi:hypothetical protein